MLGISRCPASAKWVLVLGCEGTRFSHRQRGDVGAWGEGEGRNANAWVGRTNSGKPDLHVLDRRGP
eukprot:3592105-Rhodomonas_salina.1